MNAVSPPALAGRENLQSNGAGSAPVRRRSHPSCSPDAADDCLGDIGIRPDRGRSAPDPGIGSPKRARRGLAGPTCGLQFSAYMGHATVPGAETQRRAECASGVAAYLSVNAPQKASTSSNLAAVEREASRSVLGDGKVPPHLVGCTGFASCRSGPARPVPVRISAPHRCVEARQSAVAIAA